MGSMQLKYILQELWCKMSFHSRKCKKSQFFWWAQPEKFFFCFFCPKPLVWAYLGTFQTMPSWIPDITPVPPGTNDLLQNTVWILSMIVWQMMRWLLLTLTAQRNHLLFQKISHQELPLCNSFVHLESNAQQLQGHGLYSSVWNTRGGSLDDQKNLQGGS